MKKDELKPGMIVILRNDNEERMVLQDAVSGKYYLTNGYKASFSLDSYTDDLRYISRPIFEREGEPTPEPRYDIIDVVASEFRFVTGEQPFIPWAQVDYHGKEPSANDYADIYQKTYDSVEHLYTEFYDDLCRRFKDVLGVQGVYDLPGFQKMVNGYAGMKNSVIDINWSREEESRP